MEQKKKYMLLGVIGVLLLLIGVSYAYWRLTLTQTGTNEIASSCFSLTLTNEQNEISLQKAAPISDEDGRVLTPFTFTIKNNCDTYASYTVNLELLNTIAEESRLSAEFIKAMIDEEEPFLLNTTPATPTLSNAYEAYELTTGYLDANEEVTYNLRLWMDSDVTVEDDAMNKQLESKITITASYIDHMPTDYERCVEEYGEDSIQCSIIADVSDEETGPCPTVDMDGTIIVTSTESENGYICSAPDDYGTSYYYRGNVDNNYVKFAGFYWRILRVNGNGSIRMIYAGDSDVIDALDNKAEVLANGYNDWDTGYTQIGASAYNSSNNDNAYVGYMYGTTGVNTYEETHVNINDSTIKEVIDNWYETNILGTEYEKYLSDTLFCNDRSFHTSNSGTGTGASVTYYRPYSGIKRKTLKCSQKNDRFTVNDEVIGNGSLTYSVGLLTSEEANLAGGYSRNNYNYFLYTGNYYWTMSPSEFDGSYACACCVDLNGYVNAAVNSARVYVSYGVRPVINLKPNSLKSGDGTALNPYSVEEEI